MRRPFTNHRPTTIPVNEIGAALQYDQKYISSAPSRDFESLLGVHLLTDQLPTESVAPLEGAPQPLTDPLLNYLQSPQGHEIASRLLTIVESVKHATLDKSTENVKFEKTIQAAIVVIAVASASLLMYFDKFGTPAGIFFGTVIGYAFGKK